MADISIFPALIQNATLLLAMAFIYDVLTSRHKVGTWPLPLQLGVGGVVGLLGIIIMLSPWRYVPGIVFDTRSVLLGISGLFFGVVPTAVAMAMTALFRLSQGGAAAWTGVAVICTTGTIGILWRHHRRRTLDELSWRELYLFGLLIHVDMLLLMLTLPWQTASQVLGHITLPVLTIYPVATALLGMLLVNRLQREGLAAELLAKEERLRLALAAANQGLYDLNVQTGEAKVSPEYATMLGYDPAEFHETNAKWIERLHPDDHEPVATAYRNYITGQLPEYRVEFRQRTKSGDWKWILSLGKVVAHDATGRPLRMLGTHTDITARKQSEEALKKSEQRFRSLLEDVPNIAMQGYDRQRRVVFWNTASEKLYGFTREEALGRQLEELIIPPEMRQGVIEAVDNWVNGGTPIPAGELVLQDKAGKPVNVFSSHVMQVEASGGPVMYCIDIDLAERNRAEEMLDQFKVLVENASDAIGMSTPEGKHYYQNEAFTALFGDIGEDPPATIYVDQEIGRKVFETIMAGKRWIGEVRMYAKDKQELTIFLRAYPNKDRTGRVVGLVGIHTDITERKQAEKTLQKSEARLRSVIDASPFGAHLYELDENDRLIFTGYNRSADRILGLANEQFLGKTIDEAFPGHHSTDIPARYREVAITGKGFERGVEYTHGAIQGVFDVHAFQTAPRKMAVFFIDITERKRAEEEKERLQAQLLQAQKMESVGRLAGGVAHDFNNMLQTILGYCDLTLNELDAENPLHENLLEIRKATQRSADLTRQLLAFARKQAATPKVLDLNDTVGGMLKMLQRLIGEDIDLIWMPGHELWNVKIDPSQLDQILANLAVNARDAIAGNGKVAIETENVRLDADYCADHAECAPGDYVLLTVSDNGCGMDQATLDQIFEPFFTTKEQGKGTGLGLATVYGVVRQNNGLLAVESTPGQGTSFRIYLPRFAADEPAQPLPEKVIATPAGGDETVLLVEDEEAILTLGKAILGMLGYTVLAAHTPAEALRLGQEHPGDIHLLITDVVMPEMNGHELARKMAAHRPAMRCLYMSGYTADIIARHGVLQEGLHFIQKPFSVNELSCAVRKALHKPSTEVAP